MQAFLQHVGHNNLRHIEDTVINRRSISEILNQISDSAPERNYFENNKELMLAFPDGTFNCWALPGRAQKRYYELNVGDLVLLVPWIGIHNGGIKYIGIIKAICPVPCYEASQVLWPHPEKPGRIYPYLFFFETEIGFRDWYQFLHELNFSENYNPRGYFVRLKTERFSKFGGVENYLHILRSDSKFSPLKNRTLFKEPIGKYTESDPTKKAVEITRIIRDTSLTKKIKALYNYQCQICGGYIELPSGNRYIEAHHIKPLGGEHHGPDIAENVIILCPNHHAQCDLGAIQLDLQSIYVHPDHKIGKEFIDYHNNHIYSKY